MPELPEVETIRGIVEPQLVGRCITAVEILNPQVIAYPDTDDFMAALTGQRIHFVSRRGKFLTIHTDNGDRLTLHLRMTGQLLVTLPEFPAEKHTHLVFHFSGGIEMRYIDIRRFGRFWYLKQDESASITGMNKLGLEPTDTQMTAIYLKEQLSKKKKTIKEMLHDQTVVAGIGNIYSDEILFAAGVFPEKKCVDLTDSEWIHLAQKIPEIIRWGIDTNRMTPEEYLAGMGKEYRNMPHLRAYGREGLPCTACGTAMRRIAIGGRCSCYCPNCQRNAL